MDYNWLIHQSYILFIVAFALVFIGSKLRSFDDAEKNIWRKYVRETAEK